MEALIPYVPMSQPRHDFRFDILLDGVPSFPMFGRPRRQELLKVAWCDVGQNAAILNVVIIVDDLRYQ